MNPPYAQAMWTAQPIMLRLVGALLFALAVAAGPFVTSVHAGEMAAAVMVVSEDADAHGCDSTSSSSDEMAREIGCPAGAGCQLAPPLQGQIAASDLPAAAITAVPGDLDLTGLSDQPGTQPPKSSLL